MKFITKLQRISLKAQVYEYLKQAIINGDLKVGEIYSEQYFADKLSISRTPVREAILQLQHENMVEVKANRGIIVKPLLLDEIKKIIETRLAIEGYSSSILAKNLTTKEGKNLIYLLEDNLSKQQEILTSSDAYYKYCNDEKICDMILEEFSLKTKRGHIINGHVPVKVKEGESPVKANGKLIIIDGGFCKAYHKKTGIAGYTLISNSRGLRLLEHQSCANIKESLKANQDIESVSCTLELQNYHSSTADTDLGEEIQCQINDIYHLMLAYQNGLVPEQA